MHHSLTVRVYYEDTDLAGIVYYANYLRFLERGRTEALRHVGIDQSRLKEGAGLVFVVTRAEIDYHRPARFDDLLEVTTALALKRRASLEVAQSVLRDGARIVSARIRLAVMDGTGRPARLPAEIDAALDRLAEA